MGATMSERPSTLLHDDGGQGHTGLMALLVCLTFAGFWAAVVIVSTGIALGLVRI